MSNHNIDTARRLIAHAGKHPMATESLVLSNLAIGHLLLYFAEDHCLAEERRTKMLKEKVDKIVNETRRMTGGND